MDSNQRVKDCKCCNGEQKVIVYPYSYDTNPDDKDPFKDPWLYGSGNDVHGVREDGENKYSYIPSRCSKKDYKKKIKNVDSPDPDDSDFGVDDGTLKYCCCKKK